MQTLDAENIFESEAELCRHCGGPPRWRGPLVDGAHPICQALLPLEGLLDTTDDPSIEDETYRYRKAVHALLMLWERLPRGEQDKTLHFLKCELATVNRMYARAYFTDDDDDQAGAFAALRENGFEPTIECTFGEEDDGLPPTRCVEILCVSALRQDEFFWWVTNLLAPFGGSVDEAGYCAAPGPDATRPTDH